MHSELPTVVKGLRKHKENTIKLHTTEEVLEPKKVLMIARCSAHQGEDNIKMGSKTYLILREMAFMRTTECPCSLCSSTLICSDETECHCEDNSDSASEKVEQSVQAEAAPKMSEALLQQLLSCCTLSDKKKDRDSDRPSKSRKRRAKPRKNKVQESIKGTRSLTSRSNPEHTMKSKTRREQSKNKGEENSIKKEKETKESKDRNLHKPSMLSKETANPRKNKLREPSKGTRSSTSISNLEQAMKSTRRSEPSKNKRKKDSTKLEEKKKDSNDRDSDKPSMASEESKNNLKENSMGEESIDKENIKTKLLENFENEDKMKRKEKDEDRKERQGKEGKENKGNESEEKREKKLEERRTAGKRNNEQKVTIEKKKEKQEVKIIQRINEEKIKRKNYDINDNMKRADNKGEVESEAFSKSHNKDKKFASFASSSTAVGGLYSGQRELPPVRMYPDSKEETMNLPCESPPTVPIQKYDERPSTSYQFFAPVDSHKQIQKNIDETCSSYCARYPKTYCTNEDWKKFAKKDCKTKVEGEIFKPQNRLKCPKAETEPYHPLKDIVIGNWKKLQTKLPFLRKKRKKSSKQGYRRSHSRNRKKRSQCNVTYCLSEECKKQNLFHKRNEKNKEACTNEMKIQRSPKQDIACSVRSSLELIKVPKSRRVRTPISTGNYPSEDSVNEEYS